MTRSQKRVGEPLVAPNPKSNKENADGSPSTVMAASTGGQRRSARDRARLKDPIKQREEFSALISAPTLSTKQQQQYSEGNTVLANYEENPMAPLSNNKKARRSRAGKRSEESELDKSNSAGLQSEVDAPLSLPDISMQEFAAIATGLLPVPNSPRSTLDLQIPPSNSPLFASSLQHNGASLAPGLQSDISFSTVGNELGYIGGGGNISDYTCDFNQPPAPQPQHTGVLSSEFSPGFAEHFGGGGSGVDGFGTYGNPNVGLNSDTVDNIGFGSAQGYAGATATGAENGMPTIFSPRPRPAYGAFDLQTVHYPGAAAKGKNVVLPSNDDASQADLIDGEFASDNDGDESDEQEENVDGYPETDEEEERDALAGLTHGNTMVQIPTSGVAQAAQQVLSNYGRSAISLCNGLFDSLRSPQVPNQSAAKENTTLNASAQSGQEYLVLDEHYRRNRRPIPPSASRLEDISRSNHVASRASPHSPAVPNLMGAFTHRAPPGPSSTSRMQKQSTGISLRPGPAQFPVAEAGNSRPLPHSYVAAAGSLGLTSPSPRFSTARMGSPGPSRPSSQVPGSTAGTASQSQSAQQGNPVAAANENANEVEGEGVAAADEQDLGKPKRRAARYSKTPRREKKIEPDTLEFYLKAPNWLRILKASKFKMRKWIAFVLGFPDKAQYYGKALEILMECIHEHQAAGGYVEEGYFEAHSDDMQKIIWEEIAVFRGEIKTIARDYVPDYDFIPVDPNLQPGSQDFNAQVRTNIDNLTDDAFFLRDGVDSNGSTNNFCHPIYERVLLTAFFANSSKLGVRCAEYFATEIPRTVMILVATAVRCALDEWRSGKHEGIRFKYEDYVGIHGAMDELLSNLENDPNQAMKLALSRRRLAREGLRRSGAAGGNVNVGFAVAL